MVTAPGMVVVPPEFPTVRFEVPVGLRISGTAAAFSILMSFDEPVIPRICRPWEALRQIRPGPDAPLAGNAIASAFVCTPVCAKVEEWVTAPGMVVVPEECPTVMFRVPVIF